MFCKKCGNTLEPDAVVCPQCGAKVVKKAPTKKNETKPVEDIEKNTEEIENVTAVEEKAETTEKAETVEKNENLENVEAAEKAETVENAETEVKTETTAEAEAAEKSEGDEKAENTENIENTEKTGDETSVKEKKRCITFYELVRKPYFTIPVILVIVFFLAVAFSTSLRNTLKKTFYSPEAYFRSIAKQEIKESVYDLTQIYQNLLVNNSSVNGESVSGRIEASLSEDFRDIIEDVFDYDFSDVKKIRADYAAASNIKSNRSSFVTDISVNNSKLLTFDAVIDGEENALFANIPQLSKEYAKYSFGEGENINSQAETNAMVSKNLPKKAALYKVINRYFEIALKQLNDVKVKDGKLNEGGVKGEYTKIVVKLKQSDYEKMVEAITKKAEEDDELAGLVADIILMEEALAGVDTTDLSRNDYIDDAFDVISELLELLGNEIKYVPEFTLNLYTDKKGRVVGSTVETADKLEVFSYIDINDGNKFAYKIKWQTMDFGIGFSFIGKMNGKKYSGDAAIEVTQIFKTYYYGDSTTTDRYAFVIEDLDVSKIRKGFFDGRVIVDFEDLLKNSESLNYKYLISSIKTVLSMLNIPAVGDILDDGIVLTMDILTKQNKAEYDVIVSSGRKDLCDISFVVNKGGVKNIAEVKKYEEDFEEWAESLDVAGFFKKLKKSDLPGDFVNDLEDYVESLIY